MVEESYVRLYANDFARLAVRAGTRPLEPDLLPKRIADARAHAIVMDSKKGAGHLEALATRLRDEARRSPSHHRVGLAPEQAAIDKRHDCQPARNRDPLWAPKRDPLFPSADWRRGA